MESCPDHGLEFKQIPAGVSKSTGKPYNAFWACPERGCRTKPTGQPARDPGPTGPNQATELLSSIDSKLTIVVELLREISLKDNPIR